MILRRECPCCGGKNEDNEKIFYRDFKLCRELTAFSYYDVFRCKSCGMIYAGNIEESMPLDDYYQRMSRYEGENYQLSLNLQKQYVLDVELINNMVPKDAHILDVGCAFGGLLNELKKAGYQNLYGVEPSKRNCDYAANEYGINIYNGNMGDDIPELHDKEFDLLILSSVLEHLIDVKKSVELCHSYLKKNGKLLIVVPDAGTFLQHRDLYQEFSTEHINYFDRYSLSKLLQTASTEGRHFRLIAEKKDENSIMGLSGSIISLWERTAEESDLELLKDSCGKETTVSVGNDIDGYLESCKRFSRDLKKMLNDRSVYKDGYYVWGGGTNMAMLVQEGIVDVSDIKGIFDSNRNYEGFTAYGQKIQRPDVLKELPPLPILISSQYAYSMIKKNIEDMGLKNDILNLYGDYVG